MDYKHFFARKADRVAEDLVGRFLVRKTENGVLAARIADVWGYEGGNETPSREGMKYAPGTIYLMPFRGSRLFNIATDRAGYPSCVEVRKLIFNDRTINGSGTVTKFIGLNEDYDGQMLGKEVQISGEKASVEYIVANDPQEGSSTNCIGHFYLKSDK